jgi:radical SAM protein with 4Fe4S-binding SPASM domain
MLSFESFKTIFKKIVKKTAYVNLYFQGEPFLNPDIYKILSELNSQKVYTVTSTNAHFIDSNSAEKIIDSGLSELIVSIDGSTQETYSNYRIGGELNKVLNGLKEISQAKINSNSSSPYIVFQFIVFKYNEHQINDIKELAKMFKVDELRIKSAQIYNLSNSSGLIPSDKYARYKLDKNGDWVIKGSLSNSCWKMWHSCVITWDGSIVPCCFDKDAKYAMGNLNEEDLKEIWYGVKYTKFRNQIIQGRKAIDICSNCTEGLRTSLKD